MTAVDLGSVQRVAGRILADDLKLEEVGYVISQGRVLALLTAPLVSELAVSRELISGLEDLVAGLKADLLALNAERRAQVERAERFRRELQAAMDAMRGLARGGVWARYLGPDE